MPRRAHITTKHQLLTGSWAAEVTQIQRAIEGLSDAGTLTNDCGVTLFEMEGDRDLHVNVTHKHRTLSLKGWAGPGHTVEGFVHNRRFAVAPPELIARHIRAMVSAARV
jgi:hypothetical protein